MGVYEYNWNLSDNMLPFTRVKMLAEEIRMCHEMGVSNVVVQCINASALNGPADYIAARMLWDAQLDWKVLLWEYCDKAFGAAAPMLERYYLRLAEQQSRAGQEAGSFFAAPLIFDEAYVKAADGDLGDALAQPLEGNVLERVKAAAYPHTVLKRYLAWHSALGRFDFGEAKQQYDAMLQEWKVQLDRNPQFVDREGPEFMKRLMKETTEVGLKYSTAPYEIVQPLPDQLKTALDPTGRGEELGLALPTINDRDWILTKTYSSTWDAQGLGFYREGAVWYRYTFDVDAALQSRPIGLFVGAVDDEAIVFVNGIKIGRSGPKYSNPAVFDLTRAIRYGERNLLAIQVVRNSQINELLLGGLLRPLYLFTGPAIESSAKPAEPNYRVLPGGSIEITPSNK